ncbi:Txe/YoeB family addiction module toxin [Cupriavidus sp. 2KB_3]|uniref:Txe/YoeB family addiction module toxin n=1 Tax=Cupriavidus TaxID=106589 RepID=UPI0011EDC2A7|nr:Txe/YoeB family addiction module toxin [Cupriavidus campinensis]
MTRKVLFTPDAWEDYVYWQGQDRKTLKRINQLIKEVQRTPFEGIGKPEPLVGNLTGFWSRRIDDANRLVYEATEDQVNIVACRYHY